MVLVTVLGSCVAACIHDRTAGIGGMNHFMLPDDGADASHAASDSMRYGAYAMEVLINELIKRGRPARALRSEGVRRRRGARRHDDDQHRRSQFRIRAPLSRARKDPHRRRGLAGRASAQGRVHAAHRPGDGARSCDAAGTERGRARAGARAADAEERAERLARRGRASNCSQRTPRPSNCSARGPRTRRRDGAAKPRIELFGASPRPTGSNNARRP